MPDRNYEFVQVDVFTQTPLTGNPLAIFTDARGLDDNEMQALAREMNLSETTFILPRDPDTEAQEGKKVRIFTVEEELPFAGHPTLGTALHLYASGFSPVSEQSTEITLDLKAGKIPVRFTAKSKNGGRNRIDGQVFGEMRQRDPEFGVIFSREEVARVLGIAADEIPWPVQSVSTGLPFAIVGIRNQETLATPSFFTFFVLNGAKADSKCARACFSTAEKIQLRDQRPVAPRVGWSNTGSQTVTNKC